VHLIGKEDVVKLVKELVIGHFPFLPDSYEVDVLGHMTVIAKKLVRIPVDAATERN
jgi:hypothetical protein